MSYAKKRADGVPIGGKKDLTMVRCMDIYLLITKRMHELHTAYERIIADTPAIGSQPIKQAALARAYDELMFIRDKLPCIPENS